MADDKNPAEQKPEHDAFSFNPFSNDPKPADPKPEAAPKKPAADPKPPAPPDPAAAANVGNDPFRPADNMVLDYDPMVDPGTVVGPVVDPNTTDGVDPADLDPNADPRRGRAKKGDPRYDTDAKDDDDDEEEDRPEASMSMTKADLLDRLHESAADLTKAQILEHIQRVEGGPEAVEPTPLDAPARVYSTETRTATIDGETRTWTEANEDQVPQVYREVYAQSRAAGGI